MMDSYLIKVICGGSMLMPGSSLYTLSSMMGMRFILPRQELEMASYSLNRAGQWINAMKRAYYSLDQLEPELMEKIHGMEQRHQELRVAMYGYQTKEEIGEKQYPTPGNRISVAQRGLSTSYGPTEMHWEVLETGVQELEPIQSALKDLLESELPAIQEELNQAGAPPILGQ